MADIPLVNGNWTNAAEFSSRRQESRNLPLTKEEERSNIIAVRER